MKIYNGYKRLNENYTSLTDEYEYSMANTYLESKKYNQKAVFDVFFRKIPNGGGYVVMAGLDKVKLYPGSFSDWISYEENEVETCLPIDLKDEKEENSL